jgi:glucokinase
MPADSSQQRFVGVDVGGTKIAAATLGPSGMGEVAVRPTDTSSAEALLDQIVAAIEGAGRGEAVGVAVPSVIDAETGSARYSVNVPLADVPLRPLLRERLGVPAFVDNDATCAALAEAYDEKRKLLARHLVMFTIGTGVGGGIVIDGRAFRGATGAAAELGHTLVATGLSDGAPVAGGFPQPWSLEAFAAGHSLDHLAVERGLADGREAVAAARRGDSQGLEPVEILGERLGVGVANAINTFDPELVILGGGVAEAAGELLLEPVRRVARSFILPGVGTRTDIRLARYGNDAGVRGAAMMAAQEAALEAAQAAQPADAAQDALP